MSTGVAPAPSGSELVIRPARGLGDLKFGELWEYRELLYFMTKRELQIRYKQSVFGVAWVLLQPLALAFIFSIFFGHLAKVPSNGLPYPIFALAGLVPWMFISQSTSGAAASLVGEANLLSKVYFPRLAVPLAKTLSFGVDLLIALVVLLVMTPLYGVGLTWTVVLAPAFLLLAVVVSVGAGTLLAAVNVRYRDVGVAVPLLMQIWLFATPIIYPGSLITGTWQYVYALNPMVTVVEGVRWAVLGSDAPSWAAAGISTGSAVVLAVTALLYFRRTEQFFADVV
jgi:lipopolysaccharide transport system permease protein